MGDNKPMLSHAMEAKPEAPKTHGKTDFLGVLRLIGPDKLRLGMVIALSFSIGLAETFLLYLVASAALAFSGDGQLVRVGPEFLNVHWSVAKVSALGTFIVLLLVCLSFPVSSLIASLSSRAIVRIRAGLLERYLKSTLSYRDQHREGYVQQLVGEFATRAESSIQQLATLAVTVSALLVVMMGAIASTPAVAIGVITALSLISLVLRLLTPEGESKVAAIRLSRSVMEQVAQTTRLSEEVSAYNVGPAVARNMSVGLQQVADAIHRMRYEARIRPNLFQYGTIGIVFIMIGVFSVTSPARLSGIGPLALLLIRALTYVRQIQRALHSAQENAPYIRALNEESDALCQNQAPVGSIDVVNFEGLDFKNVSYEYTSGAPVLRDVNFAISPGEMVGVVGRSGSGKSTLTGLLLRLRSPTGGEVIAGATPLREVTAASWSRVCAYVPQESRLIRGSVAANIEFFRSGFTAENVELAARAAHIHDDIVALPEGYDTLIGPGARGLSGGQRQRLAIARALLARPQLLIMDEPTSALDERSEILVSKTLEELKGGSTIVLIAHRPATLTVCDRIFEMKEGRLLPR